MVVRVLLACIDGFLAIWTTCRYQEREHLVFSSVCPVVGGQQGKWQGEVWKLAAVKYQRWSQTLCYTFVFLLTAWKKYIMDARVLFDISIVNIFQVCGLSIHFKIPKKEMFNFEDINMTFFPLMYSDLCDLPPNPHPSKCHEDIFLCFPLEVFLTWALKSGQSTISNYYFLNQVMWDLRFLLFIHADILLFQKHLLNKKFSPPLK